MDFRFGQVFNPFNTPESYAILVVILAAFLIGFLTGMLLRSAHTRRLRRELEAVKTQLEGREREVADLQDQLATAGSALSEKDKIVELQQREMEEAEQRILRLEQEKNKLYNALQDINAELEQFQASNQSYLSTIEELNDQILGIKARQEQLPEEMPAHQEPPGPVRKESASIETEGQFKKRLEVIEASIRRLEKENNTLRREVENIRNRPGIPAAVSSTPDEAALPGREIPPEVDPGNLQIVEGIEHRTEAHLKASGIKNWEDLANSTPEELRRVLQSGQNLPENNPQTWPIQARLAIDGNWTLLEEYQQQLLGGHHLPPEE